MSQPVRVSDALLLDARLAGEAMQRSIAGQVEFWASLGRALEPLLCGAQAMALARSVASRPILECLGSADSAEGRSRVAAYLSAQPYPRFEPAKDAPGLVLRTDADGTRTVGRFVKRRFVARRARKSRR